MASGGDPSKKKMPSKGWFRDTYDYRRTWLDIQGHLNSYDFPAELTWAAEALQARLVKRRENGTSEKMLMDACRDWQQFSREYRDGDRVQHAYEAMMTRELQPGVEDRAREREGQRLLQMLEHVRATPYQRPADPADIVLVLQGWHNESERRGAAREQLYAECRRWTADMHLGDLRDQMSGALYRPSAKEMLEDHGIEPGQSPPYKIDWNRPMPRMDQVWGIPAEAQEIGRHLLTELNYQNHKLSEDWVYLGGPAPYTDDWAVVGTHLIELEEQCRRWLAKVAKYRPADQA